jgi:type IV secretory pathway VirD2 relaxase
MSLDDDFRLRIGRLRERGPGGRTFVGQALRAAVRAGYPAGRAPTGRGRLGRGALAALRAELGGPRRRVVVKARVVRHAGRGFRAAPLPDHIRYLRRDGVERSGAAGRLFGPDGPADGPAFAARCAEDRHHFRFIVSPEDATQLADLEAFARELAAQAGRDLGTRLDWLGVAHWNTAHPHVHLLVRGVDDTGADLVIARDYIARGLRGRAEALVDLELGPRNAREIAAALQQEVGAERWTGLDRLLVLEAAGGRVDLRPGAGGHDPELSSALAGRAAALERFGFAAAERPGRWRLRPDLRERLDGLAARQEILATLHQAAPGRTGAELDLFGETAEAPVVGRLLARGLWDELAGAAFVVVDGTDGRVRHVRLPDLAAAGDTPVGGLVEVRPGEGGVTLVHRSDLPLEAQVTAEGATWLDRRLLAVGRDPAVQGFGAEVRAALAAREDHLVDIGLAARTPRGVTLAPGLLATLRERELAAASGRLAQELGRPVRPLQEGEGLRGVYARRVDLASGRFVLVSGQDGLRLAPWARALDRRLGREVRGELGPERMAWDLGRDPDLSR